MLNKISFCLMMLSFFSSDCFSQKRKPESRLLSENNITERKVYCYLFKNDLTDSAHYLASSTKYNKNGHSLSQVKYNMNGSVAETIESKYKDDSLEVKTFVYDNEHVISSETTYKYDANNDLKYRKSINSANQYTTETLYELDSLHHIIKTYSVVDGIKKISGSSEYDKDHNRIKQDYYRRDGEIFETFLNEFDADNNLVRTFSVKKDVKALASEKKYNKDDLLSEEITIFRSTIKLWNSNGTTENYKKGDKKTVMYLYDGRGLILEETDMLNDKIFAKIKYEYL